MPANARSLTLTDAYRSRLLALGDRVEAQARQRWPTIQQLDETDWPEAMAKVIARVQVEGARLTAGYLTAYLRSETGRGTALGIDSRAYAGLSRDGRPLTEALLSPLIGVRASLKVGKSPEEALDYGLTRGTRMAKFEAVQTGRDALLDGIKSSERLSGWQRNVAGTCAACMAFSGASGPKFEVHPGCECVPMPVTQAKSPAGVVFQGIPGASRSVIDDLAENYPGVLERAWFDPDADDIGQLAGVSNGQIRVSAKFLDDDFMNSWRLNFKSVQIGELDTLEGARRSVLTHEFGHTLEKRLATADRGAWDELHAYVNEPITYEVGEESVTAPRWQAGTTDQPSAYATESPFEYIAESFNDWKHNGLNAAGVSQHIGRIIDGALKR